MEAAIVGRVPAGRPGTAPAGSSEPEDCAASGVPAEARTARAIPVTARVSARAVTSAFSSPAPAARAAAPAGSGDG